MIEINVNNDIYMCRRIETEDSDMQDLRGGFADLILHDIHSINGEALPVQGGHIRFTTYQPVFSLAGEHEEERP